MGKGDRKTRRGKITMGSYGKSRPRKHSSSFVATASTPKASVSKAVKEAPAKSGALTDRDTVNFSEDHELNYHLKKNGLSQSKDNRAKLVDLGSALKEESGKKNPHS